MLKICSDDTIFWDFINVTYSQIGNFYYLNVGREAQAGGVSCTTKCSQVCKL